LVGEIDEGRVPELQFAAIDQSSARASPSMRIAAVSVAISSARKSERLRG
jgi:hypothetical protein